MFISNQQNFNNQKYSSEPNFHGWKPNTASKSKQLGKLVQMMVNPENKRIAISGHIKPDGDCIGATIALANMINQATGKTIDLFLFGGLPKKFNFLNTNKKVNIININKNTNATIIDNEYLPYDIAISVDTSSKLLIPKNYFISIFSKARETIKIDHHPFEKRVSAKNGQITTNNYAKNNYTDTECDSASQLIMQLTQLFKLKSKNLLTTTKEAIYTGILSDTQNFQHARHPITFLDASLLTNEGVNNVRMQARLNTEILPIILKIKNYLENHIQYSGNRRIAYIVEDKGLQLLKEEAKREGYGMEANEEIKRFLNQLLKIKDVEIGMKVSGTNFSVRSKHTDVSSLASDYNGGGHTNAAAFSVEKKHMNKRNIIEEILSKFTRQLEIQDTFLKQEVK